MPLIKFYKLFVLLLPSSLLLLANARGQSLGDPVVKITFGSGTVTRGPALAADSGSTTYTYSGNGEIGENYYTITNQVSTSVHGGFITGTDHTGNSGGYMMVVNGNVTAGTVFTRKVPGLCGQTSYQFGVWIENVLSSGGILPNMIFHIYSSDGVTELGSGISTGDVSNRTWKFYSANFTLPAGTDGVVIKLVSNASGTQGNDFAIDDLTFSPYDASTISVAYDQTTETSQTTCAGTSQTYTIKATSTLAANHVQKLQAYINGAWVDQTAGGTQTSFQFTPPAIAGTYYYRLVTAIADNIGSASCVTNSNQLTLVVTSGPIAAFSAPAITCLSSPTIFTDQSTATGTTINSWFWDFNDGQTSTEQSPAHTYTTPGDKTVTLTVKGSTGCSNTTQQTIHVSAVPTANFTASAPDCQTSEVSLADLSTPGEGNIVQWDWDYGDGITDRKYDNTGFKHQYAATGVYTIKLTVTTTTGCTATASQQQVIVHPLPVIKLVLPDVCTNDAAAQFDNKTTIADGSTVTYLWDFGDHSAVSTEQSPSHKYATYGNYNIKLIATSAYGCSVTKDTVFTVNGDTPIANFKVLNEASLCSRNDVVFDNSASSVNFGSITKVVWYFDYANHPADGVTYTRNQLPGNHLFTHNYGIFTTPGTKTYQVRMVAYSGGEACSSVPFDKTITIKANPVATVSQIGTVCQEAGTVKLITSHPGFTGTDSFSGTGISAATGVFDPIISGPGTFVISYNFTSANGCDTTLTQTVTVNPTPTVSAGNDFTMLEGAAITLKATADGNKPLTYKWALANGGAAASLSNDAVLNPVATPKDDTSYLLTVTTADGCSSSSLLNIKVLKAPVIPNTFTPNGDGTNDTWHIKYLDSYPNCTVDIFNRYGKKLYSSIGYPADWDGNYNGAQLPVGTYYYIIDPKSGRQAIAGSLTIIR